MKRIISRYAQTVQNSKGWTKLSGISPGGAYSESAEAHHMEHKPIPKCNYCNKKGHLEKVCRKKLKDKKSRATFHSQRNEDDADDDDDTDGFQGKCFKCKKKGHKSFECPSKKRDKDTADSEPDKGGKPYVPKPNLGNNKKQKN